MKRSTQTVIAITEILIFCGLLAALAELVRGVAFAPVSWRTFHASAPSSVTRMIVLREPSFILSLPETQEMSDMTINHLSDNFFQVQVEAAGRYPAEVSIVVQSGTPKEIRAIESHANSDAQWLVAGTKQEGRFRENTYTPKTPEKQCAFMYRATVEIDARAVSLEFNVTQHPAQDSKQQCTILSDEGRAHYDLLWQTIKGSFVLR